jgi:hypothetical protein
MQARAATGYAHPTPAGACRIMRSASQGNRQLSIVSSYRRTCGYENSAPKKIKKVA